MWTRNCQRINRKPKTFIGNVQFSVVAVFFDSISTSYSQPLWNMPKLFPPSHHISCSIRMHNTWISGAEVSHVCCDAHRNPFAKGIFHQSHISHFHFGFVKQCNRCASWTRVYRFLSLFGSVAGCRVCRRACGTKKRLSKYIPLKHSNWIEINGLGTTESGTRERSQVEMAKRTFTWTDSVHFYFDGASVLVCPHRTPVEIAQFSIVPSPHVHCTPVAGKKTSLRRAFSTLLMLSCRRQKRNETERQIGISVTHCPNKRRNNVKA